MIEAPLLQDLSKKWHQEGRQGGRADAFRTALLTLGSKRFGRPSDSLRASIESIADVKKLRRLTERLRTVHS
jgi:hypothetical protein